MDSLLPSTHRELPQPQLFVDLRRITGETSPVEWRETQRRNIQDVEEHHADALEPLDPMLRFDKDSYMKKLKNKITTSNIRNRSREQNGNREKGIKPYGEKFPYHKNSTRKRLNKKILKKRLRLDVEKKDYDTNTDLKKKVSNVDLLDNGNIVVTVRNKVDVTDNFDSTNDQLAEELVEHNSVLKPLNKMFTKKDDVIYKQMNFWRNQMESKRLENFLAPEEKMEKLNQNAIRKILENTILKPAKDNRRTVLRQFVNKTFEDDNPQSDWQPRSVEKVITDELMEIQETLMVRYNSYQVHNYYFFIFRQKTGPL